MYDYYLGGKDNYPADRKAAEEVIAMLPEGIIRGTALQNRKFMGRAVRYLVAEAGVRQFLDIGAGLPTMGNVHEVAQSAAPGARVAYVDNDPVVLAHARDLLHGVENTMIAEHDLRRPGEIIADHRVRSLLDFGEPVGVLLVAIMHFIQDDEDPRGIIATLMDAVPPGSYLVLSHATADAVPEWAEVTRVYAKATSGLRNRTRTEVEALFEGLELVDPGVSWLHEWHPDRETVTEGAASRSVGWCGVARRT